MHDEIHVVVDSISAADETALKDDQRCHILRLIIRHGDLEWQDGERSLAELFGMVDATGKLPLLLRPPLLLLRGAQRRRPQRPELPLPTALWVT